MSVVGTKKRVANISLEPSKTSSIRTPPLYVQWSHLCVAIYPLGHSKGTKNMLKKSGFFDTLPIIFDKIAKIIVFYQKSKCRLILTNEPAHAENKSLTQNRFSES